ncbi:MAG: LysM peptidoglycan-binding domain-containing protein [Verrucomicrobia bacterium]|nr:LysM peptidoglycan-binding domain-containing protein [Verrucomicrobiota bacterium]
MKRLLPVLLAAGALGLGAWPARAEDSADTAAAIADRQAAEERYKRLNSAVEDLAAAQAALEKRLNALSDELRNVREDLVRANNNANNYVSRSDYDALVGKLKDLDEQRKRDRDLILQKIQDLGKLSAVAPAPPPAISPPAPASDPAAKLPSKGYEYRIQRGDTFAAIADAYRQKGVQVTAEMIEKANPNLKPNKLRVGQKVFIPDPSLK